MPDAVILRTQSKPFKYKSHITVPNPATYSTGNMCQNMCTDKKIAKPDQSADCAVAQ